MHQGYVCLASAGQDVGVPPPSAVPPHPCKPWHATPAFVTVAVRIERANLPGGDSAPALAVHPPVGWGMLVTGRVEVRG